MKKILVSFMVLVLFTISSFALNSNESSALHKLNKKDAFTSLVGYIDADQQQADFLKQVFQVTDAELNTAEANQNNRLADSVLNYNLYNTKCILSENQYKKYLVFINYYLKNDNLLSVNNK